MPKTPISVTLEDNNLLWLRGRAASAKRRSLSEALDQLVTTVRLGGESGDVRSVVGTVDISAEDPELDRADASVRDLFDASLSQAWLVREAPPEYGNVKRTKRRG